MTPADLDAIMPVERRVFADPWSRHMYLTDLTENPLATYCVIRPPDPASGRPPILAYGGYWLLVDEAHIATIASHPDWRGCGLGQLLLLALMASAEARGAVTATLEVRPSNVAARALYAKLGYEVTGERRRYYRDGENALLMTTPPLASPAQRERMELARGDALARLERSFGKLEADR
jgi:ribosomal-protein-alanine N-acetyltransferase